MNNRSDNYNFALADPANYMLLREKALYQRQHPTDAEQIMNQYLKVELPSVRIRSQYIIGNYIVDFVALKQHLIIEIDGEYHFDEEQQAKDLEREKYLQSAGFKTIRLTNKDVLTRIEDVIRSIKAELY